MPAPAHPKNRLPKTATFNLHSRISVTSNPLQSQ
jgi:hypothetical protein